MLLWEWFMTPYQAGHLHVCGADRSAVASPPVGPPGPSRLSVGKAALLNLLYVSGLQPCPPCQFG